MSNREKFSVINTIREYEAKAGIRVSTIDELAFLSGRNLHNRLDYVLSVYGHQLAA